MQQRSSGFVSPAMKAISLAFAVSLAPIAPAVAQEASSNETRAPIRTRIIIGPAVAPSHPGADKFSARPYFDFARARGNKQFEFEAPDESSGISLLDSRGVAIGPAVGFEGKRKRRDVGGLNEVGFSVELGGFVHAYLSDNFRVRGELRKGVTGHRGLVGSIGADYVARDRDNWLFSIGPRVTIVDAKYNRAYFGVSPDETVRTGVASYRPRGGVQAIGATASMIKALSPRWSVIGFAKYDRIVGDAADSPVTIQFGSRDQLSGGIGVGYTFGRGGR